jgi:hypothetical protein
VRIKEQVGEKMSTGCTHDRIYHIELEIKDITDKDRFASYLDIQREIDSEGRLGTELSPCMKAASCE